MNADNIIHFIYPETSRTRPWSYINALTVRLALKIQKPRKVFFWTNAPGFIQPELVHPDVEICHMEFPTTFEGVEVRWPQYMSDIARLQILHEHGGIYMDTDMLLMRPLDNVLTSMLVLSLERDSGTSISNALMIAPPKNDFIRLWLDGMADALKSGEWANGGVNLPFEISQSVNLFNDRIIMPQSFCCPLDLSQYWLFDPLLADVGWNLINRANPYAVHIFETYWRAQLEGVDARYAGLNDNLISRLIRDRLHVLEE
jgi:hypothetical protein